MKLLFVIFGFVSGVSQAQLQLHVKEISTKTTSTASTATSTTTSSVVTPAACVNLTGQYVFGTETIGITQLDCASLTVTDKSEPQGKTLLIDGRVYPSENAVDENGVSHKIASSGQFIGENNSQIEITIYVDESESAKIVYSLNQDKNLEISVFVQGQFIGKNTGIRR